MMKKRNFVIKVLRYITIILFLLIIMIVVIKKWHSFARISVWFNINWVDIQLGKTECSLFILCKFFPLNTYYHKISFFASFNIPKYISNIIKIFSDICLFCLFYNTNFPPIFDTKIHIKFCISDINFFIFWVIV